MHVDGLDRDIVRRGDEILPEIRTSTTQRGTCNPMQIVFSYGIDDLSFISHRKNVKLRRLHLAVRRRCIAPPATRTAIPHLRTNIKILHGGLRFRTV